MSLLKINRNTYFSCKQLMVRNCRPVSIETIRFDFSRDKYHWKPPLLLFGFPHTFIMSKTCHTSNVEMAAVN